ncbi:MAG: hypothetical protein COY69_00045 [Candidatus Magasanikbacteria bacterium CG_4_10_14_0_8_um_filter_32_14]|uniref:UTP--glucose-1-phosphate uridylyltransferase n=2 Tax=Candidatus Magasanikiibacteriota TaxID=1752731 RepID=A0A2M7RB60_9BACT|nr:MAG: hypothetical protein AUJ23_01120 [Candidatus Magasanikbacteria bacterium CG1_02_32_51]PIY93742.1 MAG: hypothetical protein COY69_00045 [Candidatus Magasanikbacteria bacterium CG_4_10_14_0_8_um_filter_32_14]
MSNGIKKNVVAVIPASGKPTNKIQIGTDTPDTMLPINGKPVIGYIFDDLLGRGITQMVVVLNSNDRHTEKYLKQKFSTKCNFNIIYNHEVFKGIGYSIYLGVSQVDENKSILVYLGDTIYRGSLNFTNDFVVVSDKYEVSNKWCFIEKRGESFIYYNKPKDYLGGGKVLVGLYFFKDGKKIINTCRELSISKKKIELFNILKKYDGSYRLIKNGKWYDCGNIENYYRAKIDFLKLRSFNSLKYNDLYGYITKISKKKDKLIDEINWYKNIPQDLQIFSPRLINSEIGLDKVSYSLEYYGYQSLADYYVYNNFDKKIWYLIIDRIFLITNLFKKHYSKVSKKYYYQMYLEKTKQRLTELSKNIYWRNLLNRKNITINSQCLNGWPYYVDKIKDIVPIFCRKKEMGFLHGDLCLSNILFDPTNKIFKFIDPRGSFGSSSLFGDIKYDIAKLRHSFSSYYDFIVSDLFVLEEKGENFELKIFTEPLHGNVKKYFDISLKKYGYDLKEIKLIEALLFLSMIPLHSDNKIRQKAMFLVGIKLLNSINI